ncbi:MAG: hypothetical protein ACRDV3_00250 [Acidothermaceae bacterium]
MTHGIHAVTAPASIANATWRLVTAGALAVDAWVHLTLADTYAHAAAGGIGEGNLFRIEAAVALLVAVVVLARGDRIAYAAAFLVAASALGAVLLYRYVDVPAFGPIPSMYEPVWFTKKTISAVAEGIGAMFAVGGWLAIVCGLRRR